jgi:putative tricarboxylic transport membrane protein
MRRDGWIGFGLLLLCGWLYTRLDEIPANPLVPIGPAFYPQLLLLVTFALSFVLVLQALIARGEKKARARFSQWLKDYQRPLLCFGVFSLYVLLLPKLGFLFSTILFVAGLQWLLGQPRWRRLPGSLLVGIGTAVITYWVFEKYLYVFLPRAAWLP